MNKISYKPSVSFSLCVLASPAVTSPLFDHQGRVECWDPRVRNRVGTLDCALSSLTEGTEYVTPCRREPWRRPSPPVDAVF